MCPRLARVWTTVRRDRISFLWTIGTCQMIEHGRCRQPVFVVASVVLAVAFLCHSAWAQISGPLTRAEIDEAIRVGIAAARRAGIGGKVTPFRMYGGTVESVKKWASSGARAPAYVYTPFIRVALFAEAAHARGEQVTESDLPRRLLEPIVHIAFTWGVCCGEEIEAPFRDAKLNIFAVFDPAAVRNAPTVGDVGGVLRDPRATPLWIQQGTASLHDLGIEPPPNAAAVAAFSPAVVNAARQFRLSKDRPDGGGAIEFVAAVPGERWR